MTYMRDLGGTVCHTCLTLGSPGSGMWDSLGESVGFMQVKNQAHFLGLYEKIVFNLYNALYTLC